MNFSICLYKKLVYIPIALLFVFHQLGWAQNKLPVLMANSKKALIVEGKFDTTVWYLSPEIKPDVYTLSKSTKSKWIKIITDKSSFKIKMKPNSTKSFIVLLNGKDSCYTEFNFPKLKNDVDAIPEIHDTIPFTLTAYNNIKIKVLLDGKDSLDLKFDSGSTDFRLTKETLKKRLKLTNMDHHTFQIGKMVWENQNIHPVELSGHETEGRFGWNLFDGKIVEIDYDKNLFIVHSKKPHIGKGYGKLKIIYKKGLFAIHAKLNIKNKKFENHYLFDNGYQRSIMLDKDLVKKNKIPVDQLPILHKSFLQNGAGDTIPVLSLKNEIITIGRFSVANSPLQLLQNQNPTGSPIHILGNEFLKRFNTILDFQKNVVYLKPNHLFNVAFDLK